LATPRVHVRAPPTAPSDQQDLTIQLSFLCIGAQKAGTTWLHEILQLHPNVCLPVRKEVHFWDWHRRKGLGWYSRQFVPKSTQQEYIMGEITPCYAVLPESTIEEIQLLFPQLKIIFVARNLVERAWSAILMELRNSAKGFQPGEFPDDSKPHVYDPMEDPANYNDEYFIQRVQHSTHTSRSDYTTSIRQWLAYFPPQQILILDYRDIARSPHRFIEDVCKHIGVSETKLLETVKEGDLKRRVNSATGPSSNYAMNPFLRKRFEQYLEPFTKDFNVLLEELQYPWRLD